MNSGWVCTTGKILEASVVYIALRIIVACSPNKQPDNIISDIPVKLVLLKGSTAISNTRVIGSPIKPMLRG